MELQREQYIIRTAILALLIILAIVYLLVYSIYYTPASEYAVNNTGTGSESPSVVTAMSHRLINKVEKIVTPTEDSTQEQNPNPNVIVPTVWSSTDVQTSSVVSITQGHSGVSSTDVQANSATTSSEKILPGTRLTVMRTIADDIGIEHRYTLTDDKGIYYLYLGSSSQDLWALLQSQGGNTFALTTQTKIFANQLFGSRVVFLNLPAYVNKTVLMVVTIGNERRLIQIPYDIYHQSKKYLAERFT